MPARIRWPGVAAPDPAPPQRPTIDNRVVIIDTGPVSQPEEDRILGAVLRRLLSDDGNWSSNYGGSLTLAVDGETQVTEAERVVLLRFFPGTA
jgi:hypothetical protein